MRYIQLLALLIFTLTFSLTAASQTTNTDEQLVLSSCMTQHKKTTTTSTEPCAYYIQGFLAATLNTTQDYELINDSEGFTDRAYRTRVGKSTSKIKPTAICLAANETPQQLVERVVNRTIHHLSPSTDSLQGLHRQIYQSLVKESSCQQSD
ncbi:hypothetical protein L2735_03345 [Shewanella olleyana]|uniref:Rap1a/Tai family immunity protein n=1 Tax=Shewanella olleyana TaxID=135626 RepID=UPI00200F77DF|nr:Rap1a/Tai family immunity protein [Shewanella olleyana]MCL1065841.1 hypothetical protein [Shewanella olleyana]